MVKPSPSARVQNPPRHIAIIMDGNGRWAKARGMPRLVGHQRGADAVKTVVRSCLELKVPYLTLYAFSSENWKRPATEVDDLMGLLRLYLRRELADLHRNDIRVRFIGDRPLRIAFCMSVPKSTWLAHDSLQQGDFASCDASYLCIG